MKTLGYVRISDSKGSDVSPNRQWADILAYAQRVLGTVPELVEDIDKSGANGMRSGWKYVLTMIRKGQANVLVAYSRDRLFRDEEQSAQLLKLLRKHDCELHLVDTGMVDLNNADSVTMFSFGATMDAHYSRKISEKTKRAMAFKRAKGEKLGGMVPYGYAVVAGLLVVDVHEQAVLKVIRRLAQAGTGTRGIARMLTETGIKSKSGNAYWSHSTVAKLLSRTS